MLETILFIPVALLLIFMGTDASLRFIEKSSISSMLKKEIRENKDILSYNSSLSGEEYLDLSQVSDELDRVNENLKIGLFEIKNNLILNQRTDYLIQISLAEVNTNYETGELNLTKEVKIVESITSGNLEDSESNKQINKILHLLKNYNSSQNLSRVKSNNYIKQFKEKQYFLFADIKTKSTGIIPAGWSSSLSEINEYNIMSAGRKLFSSSKNFR